MLTNLDEPLKKYRVALLVLIALCALSCSPTKRTLFSSVDSTTQTEQVVAKEQEQHTAAKSVEQVVTVLDQEVVTVIKTYDTSQPVDQSTGVPPLQSEVIQTKRAVQQRNEKKATEQSAEIYTIEQEHLIENEVTAEVIEASEKKGLNVFQKTLVYIGAISIILLLSFIGLKLFKNYLKPF